MIFHSNKINSRRILPTLQICQPHHLPDLFNYSKTYIHLLNFEKFTHSLTPIMHFMQIQSEFVAKLKKTFYTDIPLFSKVCSTPAIGNSRPTKVFVHPANLTAAQINSITVHFISFPFQKFFKSEKKKKKI